MGKNPVWQCKLINLIIVSDLLISQHCFRFSCRARKMKDVPALHFINNTVLHFYCSAEGLK